MISQLPTASALVNLNWEILGQWGFGVLFFVAFMFLLKWVLKQQEGILKSAEEERKSWYTVMSHFSDELEKHTISAREYHNQVAEAHRYQREEHKDMIGVLLSIKNGIETSQTSLSTAVEGFKDSHACRSKENNTIIESTQRLMANCIECSKQLIKLNGK